MNPTHSLSKQAAARREMQAFDALPPEIKDWLRTATINWECVRLRARLMRAGTRKTGRWGQDRLLAQYRAEDAQPAQIGTERTTG